MSHQYKIEIEIIDKNKSSNKEKSPMSSKIQETDTPTQPPKNEIISLMNASSVLPITVPTPTPTTVVKTKPVPPINECRICFEI